MSKPMCKNGATTIATTTIKIKYKNLERGGERERKYHLFLNNSTKTEANYK